MNEELWIHADFARPFRDANFASFSDFMTRGERVRRVGDKENVRIRLETTTPPLTVYLKRHGPANPPPGRVERENHLRVSSLGIPVPEVVAAGWGPAGSFVATAEVRGGIPLDSFLEGKLSLAVGREELRRKREILKALSGLVRALHDAGLCHRDFYLCHVLIVPEAGDSLTLIDLQRVKKAFPFKRRWVIKDLASLNYSARGSFVSGTDRLRFLKLYAGVGSLGKLEKRTASRVSRKTARIRRHAERSSGRSAGS